MEKDFIWDYMKTMQKLAFGKLTPKFIQEEQEDENTESDEEECEKEVNEDREELQLLEQNSDRKSTYRRGTLNLNQLVAVPEKFDGENIEPRRWINSYNHASISNKWTDGLKVKYFRTFLKGDALDWYETEIEGLMTPKTTFKRMEQWFIRNYIGLSDNSDLDEQIDKLIMTMKDRPSNLILKLRKLLILRDPNLPERKQLEKIQEKLHPKYITTLISMPEPESVSDLRDTCLKIEKGLKLVQTAWKNQPEAKRESRKGTFRQDERESQTQSRKQANRPTTQTNSMNKRGESDVEI